MKEDTKRSFTQTYSLNKGLKKFGQKGKDRAYKEMNQLHNRIVFEPVMLQDLNQEEIDKAMESLIFLAEKRDGTIKGRICANGSTQREYIPKEAASSPTVAKESVLITGVVEAKQRRDVMTLDIPNTFIQTDVEGITTGYADGTYRPAEYVTRGQMASFITRRCLGIPSATL